MAQGETPERATAAQMQGRRRDRLEPGQVYFDLDHPENGPFVATGDEKIVPNSNIVAQADVGDEAWSELLGEGWGESRQGAGDQAYDQGAFGQEEDPRGDVLNAAPPGVGEGLTPRESEEEMPRHS